MALGLLLVAMNLLLLKEGQSPSQGLPLQSYFNTSFEPSLVN
jgi:hypothetical protein